MSNQKKLDDLERQIAQQEALLQDKKNRLKTMSRAAETRRKVLYGHAILKLLETMKPESQNNTLARLHTYITRPGDRAFLGLEPFKESPTPEQPLASRRCDSQGETG